MSDHARADKQILVAVFGIASSLLIGIILGLNNVYTGIAIYSWTFWIIVPYGAFFAGLVGASGYYAGAMLFRQKPAGGVLFNVVAASICTFLVVHFIPYYLIEVEGTRVKDAISFWRYLDFSYTQTSLDNTSFKLERLARGHISDGELGFLGYICAALQLIGFTAGGWGIFIALSRNPFCDKCSVYLKKADQQDRYWLERASLDKDMGKFSALLEGQKPSEAVRFHNEEMGIAQEDTKPLQTRPNSTVDDKTSTQRKAFRTRLITSVCPGCGLNHLEFVISKQGDGDKDTWKDISESSITLFTQEQLLPGSKLDQ
ncbi:MAG: hypothetical protein C0399_12240 [Syntrophus sp. (in: bacteria)]|nr:hypothetical protein [Syntrophus sp. (in: bacteria)]MBA4419080.1 hypothetical protein [Syntrophus sp. (in: bacteria)]